MIIGIATNVPMRVIRFMTATNNRTPVILLLKKQRMPETGAEDAAEISCLLFNISVSINIILEVAFPAPVVLS